MKKDTKFDEIKAHASNNEIEILHSKTCSCFFCRQTYDARTVNDWVNDERGVTALCPECGMDAVIGDASGYPLDKATLKEMNLAYYGEDYMEKHPLAAQKYVNRYKEGKITHKPGNEALYIQYLYLLASGGNADAAYDLGQLFENGTDFTPKDTKAAFAYYAMDCLKKDGSALTRLGVLSETGGLGKVDERGAYECYAKGMAMGSLEALIHFADCYSKGIFVTKNPEFAFDVLNEIWDESYARFVSTTGKDINIFPDCSYRLGVMFMEGKGTKKEPVLALKLFLYAEFGYDLMRAGGFLKGNLIDELADTLARIEILAKDYKLHKQDPVFDNDTFADSLELESEKVSLSQEHYIFAPGSFDKETNLFEFDITYSYPPLIVDCGNLFCGFVPDTIHWSFVDVADVKFGSNPNFDKVSGDPEDGWEFLAGEGEEATSAATIIFTRTPAKKKAKAPERKLESSKGKA